MRSSEISVKNSPSGAQLDVASIRKDFPILDREIRPGIPLVYLDSTATSQRPRQVIEAMDNFSYHSNANIHRGIHYLSEKATSEYEESKEKVAKFINAKSFKEIIYTRNTTESLNLLAYSYILGTIKKDDLILTSEMEHHSNIVPWQLITKKLEQSLKLFQ